MAEVFPDVAPWPVQAPAPADHNKPPVEETVKAEFREALLAERPDFFEKIEDLIAASSRATFESEADLAKGGTHEKTIRAAVKYIDGCHGKVKEPYLAGSRAVDGERKALVARLDEAKNGMKGRMNDFMAQREAERRAEQARQAAAEREKAAAAADAWQEDVVPLAGARKDDSRIIRSDEGVSVSGTTVWKSTVDDYAAAFGFVGSDPKVREAIDAAVQRLVRSGLRTIPGCRIWDTIEARSR